MMALVVKQTTSIRTHEMYGRRAISVLQLGLYSMLMCGKASDPRIPNSSLLTLIQIARAYWPRRVQWPTGICKQDKQVDLTLQ